jgi:hypothetical protein
MSLINDELFDLHRKSIDDLVRWMILVFIIVMFAYVILVNAVFIGLNFYLEQ